MRLLLALMFTASLAAADPSGGYMRTPQGKIVWVSADQQTHVLDNGFTPASDAEVSSALSEPAPQTNTPWTTWGLAFGAAGAGCLILYAVVEAKKRRLRK